MPCSGAPPVPSLACTLRTKLWIGRQVAGLWTKEVRDMQVPLELSTRRITLSPALEADLRKRATKLERHFDRITSCRIAVERPSNHHNEGGPYRVRVDITVPGSELVANKEAEDLNTAIRDAFDAAERQVEEFSRRRRGEVKTPVGPPTGRVIRIFPEEGFGFVEA